MSKESLTRPEFLRLGGKAAALAAVVPLGFQELGRTVANAATLGGSAKGGTLTVAIAGDPQTLDPQQSNLFVLYTSIKFTVFDTLVTLDQSDRFAPSLAQSWHVSADGKTVTFTLRKGVTFHDGAPFTASDVAFTVARLQAKATASPYASAVATVTRVEVRDPHTAIFHLSRPTPALLAQLLEVQILGRKSSGSISKHPIGTGPFRFVEWSPGDHMKVARNDKYFLPNLPNLDAIVFRPIADSQVKLVNLQTNAIQVADALVPTDVKQIQSFPNSQVIMSKPIVSYEILQFNTKKAPFNDKRVRQAIAWSIDRKAYNTAFQAGLARPGDNAWVKEYPSYLPRSDSRYGFDLDKTKALLAKAGFSKSKPLSMEILNPGGYTTLHNASLLIQSNLEKLGHKITVRDVAPATWFPSITVHPHFDTTTNVYSMRAPDPTGLTNTDNMSPTTNIPRFNPPGYASLINAAASEMNAKKRAALYRKLQGILLDECPFIVLDHVPTIVGISKNVGGLTVSARGFLESWAHARLT